jgi:hypothetical protein
VLALDSISLVQAHTHGVNWELWAAIATPVLSLLAAIGRWLNRKLLSVIGRLDNQDKSKHEFELQVNAQHRDLGERVSRLEGPVNRTAEVVTNGR